MSRPTDTQRLALAEDFGRLSDDSSDGELEAACLVSRTLNPDLDVVSLQRRVELLARSCDDAAEPWRYLRGIGFGQSSAGPASPSSSCLDSLLRTRSGLPIGLGALLISVARVQGRDAWGVNFPGHFLVRVGAALIDPAAMSEVGEAESLRSLPASARPDALAKAPPRHMALRMLNNLKFQYVGMANWDRALDIVDYQLALRPDDLSLLLERAAFWLRLGAVDAARATLETCIESAPPDSEIARTAREQLTALARRRNTLH